MGKKDRLKEKRKKQNWLFERKIIWIINEKERKKERKKEKFMCDTMNKQVEKKPLLNLFCINE